jgi:SWIM/SEC-C metal-binding protein
VARIGTERRPAVVRVQTPDRAEEVMAICEDFGIHFILGVEPDKPEDLSDIERALSPVEPIRALPKAGRNDPCPCGSGKKFKKCCDAPSVHA